MHWLVRKRGRFEKYENFTKKAAAEVRRYEIWKNFLFRDDVCEGVCVCVCVSARARPRVYVEEINYSTDRLMDSVCSAN